MKKILLTALTVFFLTAAAVSAQPEIHTKPSLVFTLSQHGILNEASASESAPSPIKFALGAGVSLPFSRFLTFEPHASFFFDYYLWALERALPAELENRTAIVPHLLLDLPAVVTFSAKTHSFSAGLGIAVLIRYAFAVSGLPDEDVQAIDSINEDFWKDLHFLYPSFCLRWMVQSPNEWKFGLEARGYYPVGNLAESSPVSPLHGGMLTVSARVTLPLGILKKDGYLRDTAKE